MHLIRLSFRGEGGGQVDSRKWGYLHGAKRHAGRGKATRFARGDRGHTPPRKFFKNGAIWCVLEYILLQFCPIKIVKIFIFFIKIIDIVLLRTIFRGIEAYSRMFVYSAIWCVLEYIFRNVLLRIYI